MVQLPDGFRLPVDRLSGSLHHVTNSYKFFWLLAILDQAAACGRSVQLKELLARMVAKAWYPANYFYIDFGPSDQLGELAVGLRERSDFDIQAREEELAEGIRKLLENERAFRHQVDNIKRYVPYRFLRPFFREELTGIEDWRVNKRIEKLADEAFGNDGRSPYRFLKRGEETIVELQKDWRRYFRRHRQILRGFCYWHLIEYLQRRNPNVPNMAAKLFRPEHRDLRAAKNFWTAALKELGSVKCIYSGQSVTARVFSLDHFVPWRYVANDLLWNIVPTPQKVNSAKGDRLPDLDTYLSPLASLQQRAVTVIAAKGKKRVLEDYCLLLKSQTIEDLRCISVEQIRNSLSDVIVPQIQIASTMGFASNWRYQGTSM